jgi:hypothetical protein
MKKLFCVLVSIAVLFGIATVGKYLVSCVRLPSFYCQTGSFTDQNVVAGKDDAYAAKNLNGT